MMGAIQQNTNLAANARYRITKRAVHLNSSFYFETEKGEWRYTKRPTTIPSKNATTPTTRYSSGLRTYSFRMTFL